MGQIRFSDVEYAGRRKKTGREVFLKEMEQVVPWKVPLGLIGPHYPTAMYLTAFYVAMTFGSFVREQLADRSSVPMHCSLPPA